MGFLCCVTISDQRNTKRTLSHTTPSTMSTGRQALAKFQLTENDSMTQTEYVSIAHKRAELLHSNVGNNFNNGLLRYNAQNLQGYGGGLGSFNLRSSYLILPVTLNLYATDLEFVDTPSIANAACLKAVHTLFERLAIEVGGINIQASDEGYHCLLVNETMSKGINRNEADAPWAEEFGLSPSTLPTPDSMLPNRFVGDVNWSTYDSTPFTRVNKGLRNRCAQNEDLRTAGSVVANLGSRQVAVNFEFFGGLTSFAVDRLIFQWQLQIPLARLSPVFAEFPTVMHDLSQFQCVFTTSAETDWTVSFANINASIAASQYLEATSTTQTGSARVCPFQICRPRHTVAEAPYTADYHAGTPPTVTLNAPVTNLPDNGLPVVCAAGGARAPSIRCSLKLGWYATSNAATDFQSAHGPRIIIPLVEYTPAISLKLYDSPKHHMSWWTSKVDYRQNITAGTQFQYQLQYQLKNLRMLYVIPFRRGTTCASYETPVSSAPVTCGRCVLDSIMVQMAGVSLFPEPLRYSEQQYMDQAQAAYNRGNGGAATSTYSPGIVSRMLWERGYNVVAINLMQGIDGAVADDLHKTINVSDRILANSFTVGGNPVPSVWDLMFVLCYENSCTVDCIRGTLEI